MLSLPKVSEIVLFCPVYGYNMQPIDNVLNTGGIAAIITWVYEPTSSEPAKVNLTVFPDGREPVNIKKVVYRDDAQPEQDYFKYPTDSEPIMT